MHKRNAVYPGTFDPITPTVTRTWLGVRPRIFDRVVVAIAANPNKAPMFHAFEQRVEMARGVLSDVHNVEVRGYVGLNHRFRPAKWLVGHRARPACRVRLRI